MSTIFQRILPEMRDQMKSTAPKDADMSWEY
jgi:hypothetical protein